jgi:hypothetical protein
MNENDRDARLREALGRLREDFRAPPELKRNIMHRVREIPEPAWKRAVDWLLRPRTVHMTPMTAGGLALAGLALLMVFRGGPSDVAPVGTMPGDPTEVAAGGQAPAADHVTRFVFVAPGANSVRMTGDFVSWDPEGVDLRDERGTGVWTVDVPLEPGVYQYTFIVDGTEWRPDPHAVSQVDDGFGQTNSVVIVSGNS